MQLDARAAVHQDKIRTNQPRAGRFPWRYGCAHAAPASRLCACSGVRVAAPWVERPLPARVWACWAGGHRKLAGCCARVAADQAARALGLLKQNRLNTFQHIGLIAQLARVYGQ